MMTQIELLREFVNAIGRSLTLIVRRNPHLYSLSFIHPIRLTLRCDS